MRDKGARKPRLNSLRFMQRKPGFANDYEKAHDAELLPRSEIVAEDLEDRTTIAVAAVREEGVGAISRKPHVQSLLGSAMITAQLELERLRKILTEEHRELEPHERTHYHKLVDSVAKLVREGRAQEEHERKYTETLQDGELMDRLANVLSKLQED